jgi:hypothetical protein
MALERLLRKLLLKPHAPAVVLLQLPSLATLVPGVQAGKEDEEEAEPSPTTEVSAMQLYASTYDVPYLRLRWGWGLLVSVLVSAAGQRECGSCECLFCLVCLQPGMPCTSCWRKVPLAAAQHCLRLCCQTRSDCCSMH